MWNHEKMTFLHLFDISWFFQSCEGVPVMCECLPITCHDRNHDSHINTMMSKCESDDITHGM